MSCLRCGSLDGPYRIRFSRPMAYRSRDCRGYFSLTSGTAMEHFKLPLQLYA